jgi:hypothetical protein
MKPVKWDVVQNDSDALIVRSATGNNQAIDINNGYIQIWSVTDTMTQLASIMDIFSIGSDISE